MASFPTPHLLLWCCFNAITTKISGLQTAENLVWSQDTCLNLESMVQTFLSPLTSASQRNDTQMKGQVGDAPGGATAECLHTSADCAKATKSEKDNVAAKFQVFKLPPDGGNLGEVEGRV